MVEIHKMILPFRTWAGTTSIAFLVCLGLVCIDVKNSTPDEPAPVEVVVEVTE